MAVSFSQLVDRVNQQLMGYTQDQRSISYLTAPMAATDTVFTVDTDTVTNLSRGLVEIDDEMILVKNYDQGTGNVTIMANLNGRGVEGTVPAIHAVDAIVNDDPAFPRARIKEAIAGVKSTPIRRVVSAKASD